MKETTLIRNVLSLAKYQFVDVSLLEWSPKWRWKTLSSSGGITCITSRNTIVLKNDIRMFLPICLHALGNSYFRAKLFKICYFGWIFVGMFKKIKTFFVWKLQGRPSRRCGYRWWMPTSLKNRQIQHLESIQSCWKQEIF